MKVLLVLFSMFLISPALACGSAFDCSLGSKCIKQAGNFNGICAGGMKPSNSYDRKPYRDPMDMTGRKGNTCSFDIECGMGGECIKSGLEGVCM